MPEMQTVQPRSQSKKEPRQNSAELFRILDAALDAGLRSLERDTKKYPDILGRETICEALEKTLKEEFRRVRSSLVDEPEVEALPRENADDSIFYVKVWVMARDFEGDIVPLYRAIAFEVNNTGSDVN